MSVFSSSWGEVDASYLVALARRSGSIRTLSAATSSSTASRRRAPPGSRSRGARPRIPERRESRCLTAHGWSRTWKGARREGRGAARRGAQQVVAVRRADEADDPSLGPRESISSSHPGPRPRQRRHQRGRLEAGELSQKSGRVIRARLRELADRHRARSTWPSDGSLHAIDTSRAGRLPARRDHLPMLSAGTSTPRRSDLHPVKWLRNEDAAGYDFIEQELLEHKRRRFRPMRVRLWSPGRSPMAWTWSRCAEWARSLLKSEDPGDARTRCSADGAHARLRNAEEQAFEFDPEIAAVAMREALCSELPASSTGRSAADGEARLTPADRVIVRFLVPHGHAGQPRPGRTLRAATWPGSPPPRPTN